jgi:radical S-adenosyl methionine domain-containing protein 2
MTKDKNAWTIDTINFHITSRCNFACKHCFAPSPAGSELPLENAKRVLENARAFFNRQNGTLSGGGRIDYAGGEPLLYPHIYDVIKYTAELGMDSTITTNGSLIDQSVIEKLETLKVKQIGISVDSLSAAVNKKIGRGCGANAPTGEFYLNIAKMISGAGIKLKINICAQKLNQYEDFSPLLDSVSVDRLKILQMYCDGQRDNELSTEEFKNFCERFLKYKPIIVNKDDSTDGYLMVNGEGNFVGNSPKFEIVGSAVTETFEKLLNSKKSKFAFDKNARNHSGRERYVKGKM